MIKKEHYCDVCGRQMYPGECVIGGTVYNVGVKRKSLFSHYEEIDVCDDCKKSFYELWRKLKDE